MKNIIAGIEGHFEQLGYFIYARRWPVIGVSLLLFVAMSSQLPNIKFDTSNEAFIDPDDPVLNQYDAFRDQFGRDEVVVVAIKPTDVFDREFLERLKTFHEELEMKCRILTK